MHARGQTLTGYGLLSSRQSGTRNIDVRFDSKANGTGVLRQFASKATRLGSRVAFWRLGVYWKPVWHILEGHFVLILANAAHVKTVPGRKSDVNDATWLADLLILVASLARPGDNATDLSTEQVDIAGKRLEILRELVPDFTRLAIVANVGNPGAVLEDARGRGSGPSARSANRPLEIRQAQDIVSLDNAASLVSAFRQSGLPCQVQQRRSGRVQNVNRSRTGCIGNRFPRPGGHQRNGRPPGRFAASLNNSGCRNGRTT